MCVIMIALTINAESKPQVFFFKEQIAKKQKLREKGKNDHKIQIFTNGYLTSESSKSFTPLPEDAALLFQFHDTGETPLYKVKINYNET